MEKTTATSGSSLVSLSSISCRKIWPPGGSASKLRLARFFVSQAGKLGEKQKRHVGQMSAGHPAERRAYQLSQDFVMMVAERRGVDLDTWLTQAEQSGLPEFKKMAKGIRLDDAAVKAAFASDWSNGQVEAQINWRTASKTDGVREGQLRLDSGFAFAVVCRGSLILTSSLLLEHIH